MHKREFRVLDGDDAPVVDRLAAAIGRDPARVLAYLLLRADREDAPATNLHLQIGTQLNRTAVSDAIGKLESADLVDRTPLRDDGRGRPPTGWRPVDDLESTARRAYDRHAEALIEHARDCHGAPDDRDECIAGSADEFVVALNWRPNGLHVPLYAASTAGWYDEFDVDVRVDHHDGSRRAVERVGSGAAEVGVAGAATVARARMAGEPIVPVAVLYQRSMTVLYTVREVFGEPLRSVEQLRGREVGMPPRSETRVLGQLLLSRTVEDDVRIVDTNGEERDALLHGDADVVTGSVTDPERFENRDMTVDALLVTDHFPVYGPTVIARNDVLTDRTETLRAFLAGTTAGWAAARSDPTSAAERIAETGDSAPATVRRTFERAAEEFGETEAVRDRGWGWQRRRTWESLRTALDQGDLLGEWS